MSTFCLERHFTSFASTSAYGALPSRKPRLIVLTDIGGDPDDQQSMIRLMTYSNEFDIEGLIATDLSPPMPELIREIVNAYGKVRGNLTQHASGYPTEQYLLDRTKIGYQHKREVADLGEGKDTEGSDWIISVVDGDDTRPVNIAIWGGPGELAQALWRISRDRTPQQTAEFVSRIRVHAIGHQDETGPWILKNYPKLWYILDHSQDGDKHVSCYRGMWKNGDRSLTTREWIDTHIRFEHGPLGAIYPPKTWSPPEDAMKEGDTPSWFYFLENGLNNPADPGYGGWGGRFQPEEGIFRDAQDTVGDETSRMATVWRWRPAYQNDFQARMDWCVPNSSQRGRTPPFSPFALIPAYAGIPKLDSATREKPFSQANHNPIAAFNNDTSRDIVYLTTLPGETVHLSAIGSSDPDGDSLSYNWFQYKEAGTYDGLVTINNSTSEEASFTAPDVSSVAIHIILQVKDSGTPNLYSYRRILVTIDPSTYRPIHS